ncbi:MAG: C45 family autoproteolytic acyltransferase/hydrolase [Armatimonadota bacterium]
MRETVRFPVVEMSGGRFEMGRQYGRQCRALIRRLARRFDAMLLPEEYLEAGRQAALEALPCVRREAPELVEEVEGIAEGAGLPFEEVFRLSCSQEMNSWQGCMRRQAMGTVPSGCTSIAVAHAEGSLVAWNMDWWVAWQPYLVLLHGHPDDGPSFLSFAIAGSVGRPGLSEHVSVAANFLPYRADPSVEAGSATWAGPGVPYSFISRMLLAQRSTADALKLLRRVRRMACLNYTLGDSGGQIACAETMPADMAVLKPKEGFLVHANSYHSRALGGLTEAQQREKDPRAYRAREVLRRRGRPLERADIYAAQRSHFPGQATGVCVHSAGERPALTLLSFVGDLRERAMWAAYGSPCRHRFVRYPLG